METRTKSKNRDIPQKKSDGTLAKKIKLETDVIDSAETSILKKNCQFCHQMHPKSKACRQNKIGYIENNYFNTQFLI
jgi:hypothetical protein